jgi:septum formation protein
VNCDANPDGRGLWQGQTPLLLASKSASRRALLAAAAIPFDFVDSAIDERAVETPLLQQGAAPATVAAHLARAKAQAVSKGNEGRLVLGADQTLEFAGKTFSKPATISEARQQLMGFSGQTHALHSALCLAWNDEIVSETVVTARLTCRPFTDTFVDRYLEAAGDNILSSVGAYQLEGLGVHLFDKIDGDHTTILGLPMLPLLEFLRRAGWLT